MNTSIKTEWDLTQLLNTTDEQSIKAYREEVQKSHDMFIKKWKDRTDFLHDPAILKKALDDYEALHRNHAMAGNLGYYYWLRSQIEDDNPEVKARYNQTEEFINNLSNSILFFTLSISKLDKRMQDKFLNDSLLSSYRHFLKRLFDESKYMLTESEEKILSLKSSPSHAQWVKMTAQFLSSDEREVLNEKKQKEKKTLPEIITLSTHRDKEIRDAAARAIHAIMKDYVQIAEAELNAIFTDKKIDDQLRGMKRPDEGRHVSDDIDSDVVDSLVEAVSHRFDISGRYYAFKAKLMGVKKLEYHERSVDYGDIDLSYTFEEMVSTVKTVMNNLDPQFGTLTRNFFDKGLVDVYPRKGKRGGAFCQHWLIDQPTYVLLNFTGKLNDVLTLAHEFGHGINNELIKTKQHALYFGTPLSTAEVASTFMEDFVHQHVTAGVSEEDRLSLMVAKLNDMVSTIFRQIACYRFEQELHHTFREKGYLSHQEIGKLFQKHMKSYMGEAVEQSPGSENWWVYWIHIRSFFYVYSYSSGLLISKSMQRKVRQDKKFIEKVKAFLSAGLSASPKEIFSDLGIDIAEKLFWNEGLDEIEQLLNETEALAKKLGKIS